MTEPRVHERSLNRENEDVSLLWILAVLVRERRIMLVFTLAGMVMSLTAALLRAKTYSTPFSFVLQSAQDPNAGALAGLAGQFGISLGAGGGLSRSPQFYGDLIVTREVLAPIAGDSFTVGGNDSVRVPLALFLRISGADPAVVLARTVHALRSGVISTAVNRTTGVVRVGVRTRSAWVSLAIAERVLQGLNHFNLITRQSQAREERRFTEGRLEAAQASLRGAEDVLQRFLQTNRQIARSPALTFERDRLQREVLLQEQVVSTLAQQYEQNRIGEVRDTPVITVIERPILAARPDSRQLTLILLLGTAAAFAVGVLIVLFRDAWTRGRTLGRDPALNLLSSEWKSIRGAAS